MSPSLPDSSRCGPPSSPPAPERSAAVEGRRSVATVPVALFASGSGSNVAALLDHRYTGVVRPDYRCLVGNNSGAGVMALARGRGVSPPITFPAAPIRSRGSSPPACCRSFDNHEIELIVLAGYLKRLPAELVRRWRTGGSSTSIPRCCRVTADPACTAWRRIAPCWRPASAQTGVTVHWVTEEYDAGPTLMQRVVAVQAEDTAETLARRVLAVEHDTYWRAVELAAEELATGRKSALSATRTRDAARDARGERGGGMSRRVVRGRGAVANPGNRFDGIDYLPDPEALQAQVDAGEAPGAPAHRAAARPLAQHHLLQRQPGRELRCLHQPLPRLRARLCLLFSHAPPTSTSACPRGWTSRPGSWSRNRLPSCCAGSWRGPAGGRRRWD